VTGEAADGRCRLAFDERPYDLKIVAYLVAGRDSSRLFR
jgi:hypothetical protein